CMSETVVDVFW
nr:immunoglobulin heavy chain junction region [Macaca mulatta]MOW19570.1 immunoglobulin heavy chain junction region [Macaca mulatta]MOW19611.1 immunoglobulin heavy chain junction region [Macaca mulatta]MOW19848.1 immunoglobulin heavy chain junction region [Macaca mulatta]MOW20492.1 immunoglobulin heavy chain junction region [Macaca mulatta]